MRRTLLTDFQHGQGFVLVATLFAVAIISIAAAYFASRVDVLRTSAVEAQLWATAEREAFSLRETLLHATSIHPRDERGLVVPSGALATDGRHYRLSDTLILRIQDERGLIAVNVTERRLLARFFTSIGIPSDHHARMVDGLIDYIDDDDFKHLNGAEKDDYLAAKKPLPANDFLRSREELTNIAGWEQLFAAVDKADSTDDGSNFGIRARFLGLFSTARHFGINVNSAPAAVLSAIPGIDSTRVGALIDQRKIAPFTNLNQLLPFANGRLDDEIVGLVGANDWRITIAKAGLPFLLECQLTISPGDRDRPTRLKECRRRSPEAMVDGAPNEISLALSLHGNNLRGRSAPSSEPFQTESRKLKFADQNERQESNRANETPAPTWLAEVIAPA